MSYFENLIREAMLTDMAEHVFRDAPPDTPSEVFSLIYDYVSWIYLGPHPCVQIIEEAGIEHSLTECPPFHTCGTTWWMNMFGNTLYCYNCGNIFSTWAPEFFTHVPRTVCRCRRLI